MKRTHLYIGAAVVLTPALLFLAAWLFYPNLAAWYLRSRVVPKYEQRLGRKIAIDKVKITRGHVELEGISVRGPLDPEDVPLVSVGKVSADFDFWATWSGRAEVGDITVERPRVHVLVAKEGDNFRDAIDRWRARPRSAGAAPAKPRKARKLTVTQGALVVDDQRHGARLSVEDIAASYDSAGKAELTLTTGVASTRLGPSAGFDKIVVTADAEDLRGTARARVEGGRLAPNEALSLTGIAGDIAPAADDNRVDIDLAGGYLGIEGELWHATGWFNRDGRGGEMHLRADRFTFDKLKPAIDATPLMNVEKTSLDVTLDVILSGDLVSLTGAVNLAGLTLRHPLLADKPVKDLGFQGKIAAKYDRAARLFELSTAEVLFRGVKARVEGYLALAGGRDGGDAAGFTREHPRLRVRLSVPEVTCQQALKAFPPELVPRISGFKLKGKFGADVSVDIDWANLEALELGGKIGIYGCEVLEAPKRSDTAKLLEEFEHTVEVEKEQYMKFVIGPSNPDFVLLADVSPNLIASLTTTEDGAFFHHKGFIIHGFRTALIKNLQAGYFKYGASSITMQFVKNILLHREKTISRKLQELFLTWYVEETLEKERILEIYLNAIEFGPGLYGIGRASYHYFGKPARDLNLKEAAFFSTLLPNPKKRHLQYCDNKLWKVYEAKIGRILKLMHEREKITEEQLLAAEAEPLAFVYPPDFDAKKCRKDTERIIKNSRSTTPSTLEEDTVDVDDDEVDQAAP